MFVVFWTLSEIPLIEPMVVNAPGLYSLAGRIMALLDLTYYGIIVHRSRTWQHHKISM